MSTKNKVKAKAAAYVPQSRDDCAADIRKLGDLNRQIARAQADMNDAIAAITAQHQPLLDTLQEQARDLATAIQTWAEANRDAITDGGKTKTANLITGEVAWRQRPPSVSIKGADTVIETLHRLGLQRFIRSRDEVNKEAILNEPDAARGIAGISLVTGVEDFSITPFEQEAS